MPGVAVVPLATPNENADTAPIQVIPTTGPDDPATADLVHATARRSTSAGRRRPASTLGDRRTAVAIDVSQRLGGRAAAVRDLRGRVVAGAADAGVPLDLGAGQGRPRLPAERRRGVRRDGAVFQQGWFERAGQRRRDRARHQLPADHADGRAVRAGHGLRGVPGLPHARGLRPRRRPEPPSTTASSTRSRVVAAAALIMFAVFAASSPRRGPIKPIAFALAIGVLIDAFVVRMTLVPAVMKLLGNAPGGCPAGWTGGCRSSTSRARRWPTS